jgi:hypothetical protein
MTHHHRVRGARDAATSFLLAVSLGGCHRVSGGDGPAQVDTIVDSLPKPD